MVAGAKSEKPATHDGPTDAELAAMSEIDLLISKSEIIFQPPDETTSLDEMITLAQGAEPQIPL